MCSQDSDDVLNDLLSALLGQALNVEGSLLELIHFLHGVVQVGHLLFRGQVCPVHLASSQLGVDHLEGLALDLQAQVEVEDVVVQAVPGSSGHSAVVNETARGIPNLLKEGEQVHLEGNGVLGALMGRLVLVGQELVAKVYDFLHAHQLAGNWVEVSNINSLDVLLRVYILGSKGSSGGVDPPLGVVLIQNEVCLELVKDNREWLLCL